jgi:hypothetical protein
MSNKTQSSQSYFAQLFSFTKALVVISLVQAIIWVGLFSLPLFSEMVFFYRGIVFLLIAVIATAMILFLIRNFLAESKRNLFDRFFTV